MIPSIASQPNRASRKGSIFDSLHASTVTEKHSLGKMQWCRRRRKRTTTTHYDDTSNSGAIRSATPSNFLFHASSLSASFSICPRDNTRGCTHVITAFWSTWSIEPRISFKLDRTLFSQYHNVRNRGAIEKKAPQRFHDKVLDLIQWQSGLFGDRLERHRPVIGTPRED